MLYDNDDFKSIKDEAFHSHGIKLTSVTGYYILKITCTGEVYKFTTQDNRFVVHVFRENTEPAKYSAAVTITEKYQTLRDMEA